MSQLHNPTTNASTTGQEPQLCSEDTPRLTGLEPMLGGARRVGVDVERIRMLLNAPSDRSQKAILDHITQYGQAESYAQELAQVVPARARQRTSNWRGRFTVGQRCRAMAALAEIGSYESILPLLDALADSVHTVRESATHALTAICKRLPPGDTRTKAAYHVLVRSLRTLPLSARKVVARILSGSPPDLVLAPLLRDGLAAKEWGARREAAWVLGMLGDRRATIRLIATLDDPSSAVRASAAWALGRLDAPIAIPHLEAVLSDDDEDVRAIAVEALGGQVAWLIENGEEYRPVLGVLVEALEDADLPVRHSAWEALSALDVSEARIALYNFLSERGVAL